MLHLQTPPLPPHSTLQMLDIGTLLASKASFILAGHDEALRGASVLFSHHVVGNQQAVRGTL